MAGLDVNQMLISGLLGNAPTEEEVTAAKEKKEGALTAMKAANATPMRGADYSPFQDMVAGYLKTMVPGWNQYGLGAAVARPHERLLEDEKLRREQEIARTKTELGDAERDLTNMTQLQKAAMMAGVGINRLGAAGNKIDYRTTKEGDIIALKGGVEINRIASSYAPVYERTKLAAYAAAVKDGIANPEDYAHEQGLKAVEQARGFKSEAKATPSAMSAPATPTAGEADYSKMPPELQNTIQAILARSENSDNPELIQNSIATIKKLSAPYLKPKLAEPVAPVAGSPMQMFNAQNPLPPVVQGQRDETRMRVLGDELADYENRIKAGETLSAEDANGYQKLKTEIANASAPTVQVAQVSKSPLDTPANRLKREGVKLHEGEKLTPEGTVAPVQGSTLDIKQKEEVNKASEQRDVFYKHAQSILDDLDTLIGNEETKKKPHPGLHGAIGNWDAKMPDLLKSETSVDARRTAEALLNKVSVEGLQELRKTGTSPGSITEREWPIFQNIGPTLQTAQSEKQYIDNAKKKRREILEAMGKVDNNYANRLEQHGVPYREMIRDAKDAIAKGAPKDAVLERLRSKGINDPRI